MVDRAIAKAVRQHPPQWRLSLDTCLLAIICLCGLVAAPAGAQVAVQNSGAEMDAPAPDQEADQDRQNDDALLKPLTRDDDFGVEWPDFEAPVLNGDNPVAPDGAQQPADPASPTADAETDIAEDADASEDSKAIASEIAETINQAETEEIITADDAQIELGSLDRKFGNFRLVLSYIDDTLSAADQESLAERFDTLSALEQADADSSNIAQLRRRAQKDRDVLEQLLRVYGHYDGFVTQSVDAEDNNPDNLVIVFTIQAGAQYNLGDIDLGNLENTGADYPFFRQSFGLDSGDPINSYTIIEERDDLANMLAENGYTFATLDPPDLLIDHAENTGDLSLPVEPGSKYIFGDIRVGDDALLDADHLALIARFESGQVYRRSRVEDLRRAILATGLVSSVSIEPVASQSPVAKNDQQKTGPTPEPADAKVDLAVDIVPAPLRTIAGEIGFGTGEGLRVAASWEHRNLFPPEGLLRFRGIVGTQEQLLGTTFRRNNFRERDQILIVNALAANVQRDAFDARTLLFSASLQRQTNLIFQKKWTWSVGTEFVLTDESDIVGAIDPDGRRTFAIAALPLTLAYDDSNDLLNPTTGFRLAGLVSPELSFQSGTFTYARTQIDGSFYQPVSDTVVMAGRVRFASIIGADALDIAPSRRFYSGGGGSVRGFGFQDVGPRDVNGDPTGGRSLAEFSIEARIRIGDFGVVPFVDAGNVYNESLPTFEGLRYGVGIGLRYYSSFGPLRLDIGTPINPRDGDSRIGVYVSLGQAF